MNKIAKIIVTAGVIVPLSAAADGLPKPVAGLEPLVGTWKGSGSLQMGKDKAKIDASLQCKRTSAQFGVECTFHVTGIPGVAAYEETDLFGYEPNSNSYHWFSVTNAGETHDHVAAVSEGSKRQWVYTGTQEGKPFKEVIDLEFGKDDKSMSARAESFVAGASASVMQITLRK